MKLSIIVPVYNVKDYLPKCVDSILSQSFSDFELILVNDKSPDDSSDICRRYASSDKRVVYVEREVNGGLSAARNSGLKVAKGDIVTFIDSDDYIAEGTFEAVMDAFTAGVDIVEYPIFVDYGATSEYILQSALSGVGSAWSDWISAKGYFHCYACNKFFRRSLWNNINFPIGKAFEDVFTIPYLFRKARHSVAVKEGMYYYCCRQGSISRNYTAGYLADFVKAELMLFEELKASKADKVRLDEYFITMCNWQAQLLKVGGDYLLPCWNVNLAGVLRSNLDKKIKIKSVLYFLLGKHYCRILSKYIRF